MSILTLATLQVVATQRILNVLALERAIEVNKLKIELDNENDRKAVEIAHANIQARMLEGLYDSADEMEMDLAFEIELQKKIHRDQ